MTKNLCLKHTVRNLQKLMSSVDVGQEFYLVSTAHLKGPLKFGPETGLMLPFGGKEHLYHK